MAPRSLSAGVAVYRPADGRFLLLRAYTYWDFPKGGLEPGEDALSAARREVREETGIDDLRFAWGERSFDTPPYARGKVARYFVAQTDAREVTLGVSQALGRPEHHEYRWVTAEEALTLVGPRVAAALRWALALVRSDEAPST